MALCLAALGCSTARPRSVPRPPSGEDHRTISRALGPLLEVSGLWRGSQDGCAVGLGILPVSSINLGVGPHPRCKFALLVTEGALEHLPPDELQAALAHEMGHVELGHVQARRARREVERGPVAAAGAPGVGAGLPGEPHGLDRAFDRNEESAADRFAVALLGRLPGPVPRCRALVALLARLDRERSAPRWTGWVSTHPTPAERLEAVKELCS